MPQIVKSIKSGNATITSTFDIYNETFSGDYPNIKYKADVRVRCVCDLGYTSNTTGYIYHHFGSLTCSQWFSNTDWHYMGQISADFGCERNKVLSYYVASYFFFTIEGWGSFTTSTIPAPTIKKEETSDIDITSAVIAATLSSNPRRLYVLRAYNVNTSKYVSDNLSGTLKLTGLTKNVTYRIKLQAWMADLSSAVGNEIEISFTTRNEYPPVKITDFNYEIIEGDTQDTVDFTVGNNLALQSDVSKIEYTLSGSKSVSGTITSFPFSITLPKNGSFTLTVKITDSLNRYDTKTVSFKSNFTTMILWVLTESGWKCGISYKKDQLCKLWVNTDDGWKESKGYGE